MFISKYSIMPFSWALRHWHAPIHSSQHLSIHWHIHIPNPIHSHPHPHPSSAIPAPLFNCAAFRAD